MPAALAASRVLQHQLHGVSRFDPQVYAAVAGLLGCSAVLAAAAPAVRAITVDTLRILRSD